MKRPPLNYRFAQFLGRTPLAILRRLHVSGLEHVPATGPFLLLANHQSFLDPILLQAVCPRTVHTMAKSTQFANPASHWIMRQLMAFPVRRFMVDPQAVRIALRRIEAGEAVGIYIEGERSWDGLLQPPRRGTIRLALKAHVPILPAAIVGAYQAWPRWDPKFRPEPIHIRFGQPFRLPSAPTRKDREELLPAASAQVVAAVQALIDEGERALNPH